MDVTDGYDIASLGFLGIVRAGELGMWLRERKLAGPLRRIAEANGWTFAKSATGLTSGWSGKPFGVGTERRATSVVRGQVSGRGFKAFNYTVVREDADSNQLLTYYAVVALDLPVNLPVVEIRSTLGGVEQAVGLQRIEFEHEAFNRRYRVSADDPKYASDVLSPRTIELLLAGRVENVRIGGGRAVAWGTGRLEVHELLGWSRALDGAVDLIPDFVWKDHQSAWSAGRVDARFESFGGQP